MPCGGPSALDGVYSCGSKRKNMKRPPEIETSNVMIDRIKWWEAWSKWDIFGQNKFASVCERISLHPSACFVPSLLLTALLTVRFVPVVTKPWRSWYLEVSADSTGSLGLSCVVLLAFLEQVWFRWLPMVKFSTKGQEAVPEVKRVGFTLLQ